MVDNCLDALAGIIQQQQVQITTSTFADRKIF